MFRGCDNLSGNELADYVSENLCLGLAPYMGFWERERATSYLSCTPAADNPELARDA